MVYQLLDPKIDIVFKMLLADEDSEPILVALLNAVLHREHRPIIKAKVLNPEIPRRFSDDKGTFLDILAELDNGACINVEMQMKNTYDARPRALFHWARIYSSQLKRGNAYVYKNLKPVYSIFFLNYREFKEVDPVLHHKLHISHAQYPHLVLPQLELHFIELAQLFHNSWTPLEVEKKLALWAKFLLNPADPRYQEVFMTDPDILKATEKLQKISSDAKKRERARMREKATLDWNSSHYSARLEGVDEGKEIGLQEGKEIGLQEGKEIGLQEGVKQAHFNVIKALVNNSGDGPYTAEQLHAMTHIPLEQIKEILSALSQR